MRISNLLIRCLKVVQMKKVLLSLFMILTFVIPVQAAAWIAEYRVPYVGEKIVKKNSLPYAIKFKVVEGIPNNLHAVSSNIVQVSSSDLAYAANDDEVAYVIAYELGGIINNSIINKKSNPKKTPDTVKFNDIMGMDLMLNGGYNPLAGIAVLVKMPESSSAWKPVNSERRLYLYDYLAYNYPTKVKIGYKNQEYQDFLSYIEPKLKERKSNKNQYECFCKTQINLNKKREKQFAKLKKAKGFQKWNITYDLLQSITEPEKN